MRVPFDFNLYSSLLLPAFINGLLFGGLSFARFWRERRLHDLFLGLLLLFLIVRLSFWMLGFAGWYDTHDGFTTVMFYFPFNTLALVGPALYFYFLSLTNRDFRFSRKYWPHLVLPLMLLLLYLLKAGADYLLYYPFPKTDAYQFGTRGPLAELDKADLVYLLSYLSLGYYLWLVGSQFKSYQSYLLANFSDLESFDLRWLRQLISLTGLALLILCVFYLANYWVNLGYILNWYPYLLLGLAIYFLGIKGYVNGPELFRHLQFNKVITDEKPAPQADLESWKQNLQDLMALEQPYLDADLSLARLAAKLQSNEKVISRVINEGFNQNFNDYINSLRVNAVIAQFGKQQHLRYSLMGIAYDCGFNSKTTFNRAFKKSTGQTPSAYLGKLEGSNHHLNP